MLPAASTEQRVGLRYRRISFDDSKEQLGRQETDVDAICALHGYDTSPAWLFTDEDESGNEDTRYRQGKGERPGLLALDAVVSEQTCRGQAVTVVAWEPGRLFRDAGHKEHYFRRWARSGDVLIHTKAGIWNPRDGRDRFVSTLIAAGDQFYADSVREKVVRAHDERRTTGKVGTGWPGFGYKRGKGGEWLVDETEAALIREAAADLLAGKTATTIVARWASAGVATKLGGQWTLTTFRRVMTKPSLAAKIVHRGREIGRGTWEPILDEPTLRLVQGRLGRKNGPRAGAQLLTGVLYCGRCRPTVKLNSNRKGSRPIARVYGCRQCGSSNVDADAVEQVYVEKMWERLNDPSFLDVLHQSENDTSAAIRELADQEAELELLKAHADVLPVSLYVAKYEAIENRISDVHSQLNSQLRRPAATWARDLPKLKKAWDRMSLEERRSLLLAVVGPSLVDSHGTSGHRVTPARVRSQLRPMGEGTFGKS